MNYGYIRVSTDRQTVENQRYEIEQFCLSRGIVIDEYISETVSGTKSSSERKLGDVLGHMVKGDTLIVSELTRIGRNLLHIMSVLNSCMEKEIKVFSIKEGYELGNNLSSKVLAFAFGLAGEIERQLISQRTREALARKKSEGMILGRKVGRKSDKYKLTERAEAIFEARRMGKTYSDIATTFDVDRRTVKKFIETQIP